ncbi:MAG: hypothetical protein ACI8TQ_001472 [Planctomycetota bacterium]|jgi:hypothetical protein
MLPRFRWVKLLGRVDLGRFQPRPPTDPDVRNSRIRLLRNMGSLRGA